MSEKDENEIKTAKVLSRNADATVPESADLEEMQDTWFLTGLHARKELSAEAALQKVHRKMDASERTSRPYLAIAASISLLAAVATILWYFVNLHPIEEIPPIAQSEVFEAADTATDYQLPDGSHVALNRFSNLSYLQDNTAKRQVKLVGEAFFEVKHDPKHPFVVTTADLRIEVIGTQFNVKAYPNQPTIVTVKEGKVKTTLLERNESLILTAEDQIVNQPDQPVATAQKVDNANYIAWKTGLLEFKDSELPEVAARLEELYNITIAYPDRLAECKLTAKFDNQDLDFILKVLEATLKIEVEKTGRRYTFTGKGC